MRFDVVAENKIGETNNKMINIVENSTWRFNAKSRGEGDLSAPLNTLEFMGRLDQSKKDVE